MYILYRSQLIYFLFSTAMVICSYSNAATITKVEISPDPNYKQSSMTAVSVLIDSSIGSYPIWKNRNFIGWSYIKPIKIYIETDSKDKSLSFLFHSSKNTFANAYIPRMINVFAVNKKGGFQLLTSSQFRDNDYKNKSNHWLQVNVQNVSNKYVAIIHPKGRYFFIDEIKLESDKESLLNEIKIPIKSDHIITNNKVMAYSSGLLKKSFSTSHKSTAANIKDSNAEFNVWSEDPWRHGENNRNKVLPIIGYDDEFEYSCVGLNSGTGSKKYSIRIIGIDKKGYEVFIGKDVLAADGVIVNDVFIPYENNFIATDINNKYIYIKFNLKIIGEGKHKAIIEIKELSSDIIKRIMVPIEVFNINVPNDVNPFINVWSYTHNKPIWDFDDTAEVQRSGVNVWVIPPNDFFSQNKNKTAEVIKLNKFKSKISNLNEVNENTLYLIFLSWNLKRNPFLNEATKKHNLIKAKQHLDKVINLFKESSIDIENIVFYPVDEPTADHYELLKLSADFLKMNYPKIKVYANPIRVKSNSMSLSNLISLKETVDIWQPALNYVDKNNLNFFRSYNEMFWVYHNPETPAKSSDPIDDYRLTLWHAWFLSGSGAGFWSYDDTKGTSSWDDFDGVRPDWAVVYEHEKGVYVSRRWESFKQGIEDFKLFKASKYKIKIDLNDEIGTEIIDKVRLDALSN